MDEMELRLIEGRIATATAADAAQIAFAALVRLGELEGTALTGLVTVNDLYPELFNQYVAGLKSGVGAALQATMPRRPHAVEPKE